MTRVFTGNVFITTSREAIEKIFFAKEKANSYRSILLTLTEEEIANSYIVSPGNNGNLMEFDYSHSVSRPSNLRLKFLETDDLFENFFIGRSSASNLLVQIAKELYTEAKLKDNNLTSKEISRVESTFVNEQGVQANFNEVYFAFGVGDDLDNWGGPFTTTLQKASLLTTAEGVKEIEMVFTAATSFLQANSLAFGRSTGLYGAVNKFSRVIADRNLKSYRATTSFTGEQLINKEHSVMTSLVTDYIANAASNPNVIVLLPDLNSIVNPYFSVLLTKKRSFKSSGRRGLDAIKESVSKPVAGAYIGLINLVNTGNTLMKDLSKNSPSKVSRFRKEIKEYIQFFREFGINLLEDLEDVDINTKIMFDEIQEGKDKFPDDKGLLEMRVTNENNDSIYDTLPDFYIPLRRIIEGYKSLYGKFKNTTGFDIDFLEESDMKVLKMWKKEGFIKDETKPALIFGSRLIIDNLLYLRSVVTFEQLTRRLPVDYINKEDLAKYFVSFYRNAYYKEYIELPRNSSFGEEVVSVDKLSLDGAPDDSALLSQGRVVFRYNLDNPNVMGLSVKYNQAYTGVYNMGIKQKALVPFVNSIKQDTIKKVFGKLPKRILNRIWDVVPYEGESQGVESDINIIVKMLEREGSFTDPDRNILLGLNKSIDNIEALSVKELAALLYLLVEHSTRKKGATIEVDTLEEVVTTQENILRELAKLAIEVDMKTIPFFKLTQPAGTQCILLARNNSIMGYDKVAKVAPYTGAYSIEGFRHFMDGTEMYSEFHLKATGRQLGVNDIPSSEGVVKVGKLMEDMKANFKRNYLNAYKDRGLSKEYLENDFERAYAKELR